MNIIVLQYIFLNDGSSRALIELLCNLSKKDCKYLVIYSRKSKELDVLKQMGIRSIRIPYLKSSDRGYSGIIRYLFILLYMIVNIIALLRMLYVAIIFKAQIIHTNVSPINLGYYLAKLLHIPHVWHLREFRKKEDKCQPICGYAHFLRLINKSRTIATTKSLKDFYRLTQCQVIYDGVIDTSEEFILPLLRDRHNSFLFVGRVEQSKGIEILIKAFAEFCIKNNNWHLDIVGEYSKDYHRKLTELIQTYGIHKKVHFLGVCNDVSQKMLERKVVVISSLSEGFGYVTVEAMSNKCFVIANNNTGTKEQLDNAKNIAGHDIAYRFTTSKELLTQMETFASVDISHHQELVDQAYKVVNNLYGINRYGDEVYNYYRQLIH